MTVQSTVLIETLEEYWWCTAQTFDGSAEAQAAGPNLDGTELHPSMMAEMQLW